jgi:hypothetical protein
MSPTMLLKDSVRRETRLVRDIQIIHQDLLPLANSGNKIPGTMLDAYAALLQNNASDPDFYIFSSRLGPLVKGLIPENIVSRTVIMRTTKRTYIGKILDIYKKGSSGRHGSVDSADSITALSYLSLEVYLPFHRVSTVDILIMNRVGAREFLFIMRFIRY